MNKNIIIILLLFISISFVGCEKKQEVAPLNQNEIRKPSENIKKSSGSTAIENKYQLYEDEKTGFSIEFPSIFVPYKDLGEYNYGDEVLNAIKSGSKVFTSPDAIILLSSDNDPKVTLKEEYDYLLALHSDISYKQLEQNWFVLSWNDGLGHVVYLKEFKTTNFEYYFKIQYPSEKKKVYDEVISHMFESCKVTSAYN